MLIYVCKFPVRIVLALSFYSILGKNGETHIATSLLTNSMRVTLLGLRHSGGAVPVDSILAHSACHSEC